jgi:hypothetical protein
MGCAIVEGIAVFESVCGETRSIGGEKGPESRGGMSFFGVLRLRLSQETAPNSAQDDEFNYENNF